MKKLIRDYIKLPSEVVQLMIDALSEDREGFEVDMDRFGGIYTTDLLNNQTVCLGCAATKTLEKLAGIQFTPKTIVHCGLRSEHTGFAEREVRDFEIAIDALRGCYLNSFAEYTKEVIPGFPISLPAPECAWGLETHNYKQQLPIVQQYADLLKSQGL